MGQVMNVEGCTALITGANRGLGRALAGMLVQRGARKVYAAARDPTAITDLRLTPVRLDVTAKDDISAAAMQATRSPFARVRGTRIRYSHEQARYFNSSQHGSPCAV
jgi:NAD(P)-dependent dehydrogenase (short-subunit alcohol dehydrogenase family)